MARKFFGASRAVKHPIPVCFYFLLNFYAYFGSKFPFLSEKRQIFLKRIWGLSPMFFPGHFPPRVLQSQSTPEAEILQSKSTLEAKIFSLYLVLTDSKEFRGAFASGKTPYFTIF